MNEKSVQFDDSEEEIHSLESPLRQFSKMNIPLISGHLKNEPISFIFFRGNEKMAIAICGFVESLQVIERQKALRASRSVLVVPDQRDMEF